MRRFDESKHRRDPAGRFTKTGIAKLKKLSKVIESDRTVFAIKGLAADLTEHGTKVEPKLTKMVRRLAKRTGGSPTGLDFRLKGFDSLVRKLSTDVAERHEPPEAVASKVFDVNRYTIVFPDSGYGSGASSVLAELRATGHKLRIKNYWKRPNFAYQGINVQVRSPDGTRWELQFHTAKSAEIAEGPLHRLFEAQRVLPDIPKNQKRRAELNDQMFKAASVIPIPPDTSVVNDAEFDGT